MPNACAWPAGPAASAAGPATERKKNVPSMAMPMALPIWFTVESTPPAAPALRPGTPARTTSTRIGAARPSPRPPTKRARASSPYPGTAPSSTNGHSRVPAARNYWEFPATPIDAEVIGVIGAAISRRHVRRADRTGEGEPTTLTLEPHHLVVWAGRWYLVAFEPEADRWRAMRVDRLTPRMPTGRTFDRRPVPHGDPATFVMTTYDRGDTPAEWPCRGSALLALPASLVARFAPRRVDGRVRHRLHLPPHPRRVVLGRPGRAAADLRRGPRRDRAGRGRAGAARDRKSTRLNSSHVQNSYAVFC